MYQQLTLIGNLGQDPEMRYTPDGIPVTSFSLAVNKNYLDKDGKRIDKTLWFRITAWRKLAETASQYLTKGRQIMVVGEIEEARPWTDRDGNNRASLEVTAQTIKFLNDGKGKSEASNGAAPAQLEPSHTEDHPF